MAAPTTTVATSRPWLAPDEEPEAELTEPDPAAIEGVATTKLRVDVIVGAVTVKTGREATAMGAEGSEAREEEEGMERDETTEEEGRAELEAFWLAEIGADVLCERETG